MDCLRLAVRGRVAKKKKIGLKLLPFFIFVLVLPIPHDIVSIRDGDVETVSNGNGVVEVNGYQSVVSPISIMFYSHRLCFGNDTKGAIKGSPFSVFHEWVFHEACLWMLSVSKSFLDWTGIDSAHIDKDLDSLSGLTIQGSIFSDSGHGFPGFAMKATYVFSVLSWGLFPILAWDLIAGGGWASDWN